MQRCPAHGKQLTGREAAHLCARRNWGGIKRNGDICACHRLPGRARQGKVEELPLQDEWVAHSCPPMPSPATQPDVDILSGPYGDIPELGLVREERALSSLYMMSCSCQVRAKVVSLCSKQQLNAQNYRETSLPDHWQQGESLPLCAPGASSHYQ